MKTHNVLAIATLVALSALAGGVAAQTSTANPAGTAGSSADKMRALDTNGDGRVSAAEYTAKPGMTQANFDKMDTNKDGALSAMEMDARSSKSKSTHMDKDGKAHKMDGTKPMSHDMPTTTDTPTSPDAPMASDKPATTPPADN